MSNVTYNIASFLLHVVGNFLLQFFVSSSSSTFLSNYLIVNGFSLNTQFYIIILNKCSSHHQRKQNVEES